MKTLLSNDQSRRGDVSVSATILADLSEGELMDLLVPSSSSSRRVLVMWLYLKSDTRMALDEFEPLLTSLAERELQTRASKQIAVETKVM